MITRAHKNLLLGSILLLSCLVLLKIGYTLFFQQNRSPELKISPLPADVERVLEGYSYSETNDGLSIHISGRRIVSRGRKVLGLRSNAVKANFFDSVEGKVMSGGRSLVFSADEAEWDAHTSHPFLLKKNVSVVLDGKAVADVKRAKIYFKQGLLEVQTGAPRWISYRLK